MSLKQQIAVLSVLMAFFMVGAVPKMYGQENKHTITGKVIDSQTKNPLIGANILIKGTNTGTSTDEDGKYKLSVSSLQDTIVVTYIGYTDEQIPIKRRTNITVNLESNVQTGKNMVVTAFGGQEEEEDVVGAVTTLNAHQKQALSTAPTANLTTSLAGRIPGLIAYQRGGAPGNNNAKFFVRGVQSFGYGNNPLILIDGVRSTTNALAQLNPNDIESFSILKDATSTALYGSKAANGVLIIKTKTGTNSSISTSVRIENNISMPTEVPKLADPITYMRDENNATISRNPLSAAPYTKDKIAKTLDGNQPYLYPAVNWRNELFKNFTDNQRYALNIRGGGSIATYYVSGSFSQSNGLLKVPKLNSFNNNIKDNNFSLRANVNVNLTKSTKLAIKMNGIFDDYQGPIKSGREVYNQVVTSNPVRFPAVYPRDSAHAYVRHPLFGGYRGTSNDILSNPYADMVKGYRTRHRSTINAQFRVNQDLGMLTKGLGFKALLNEQRFARRGLVRAYTPYYYDSSPVGSGSNVKNQGYLLSLLNPQEGNNHLSYEPRGKKIRTLIHLRVKANYNRTFGRGHGVTGLLAVKARKQINDEENPTLKGSLPQKNVNFAGRLGYNYKHRYYAQFNVGVTGSERFALGHRYGFFPSGAIKYNISNEKFWEPIHSVIQNLAIRASYGVSGNDQLSAPDHRFLYLSDVNFNSAGYTTGENSSKHRDGISFSQYANPRVTWEKATKANIGIDMKLVHKFKLHLNFYRDDRSNILQERVDLTDALGLQSNPRENYGEVKNKGVDSRLVYSQSFNSNISLSLRGNFTFARNKVVKYSEDNVPDSPNISHKGNPIDQPYGLYADRLFIGQSEVRNSPTQNFGPYSAGDIKYRDVNGDGQITNNDYLPIGYPTSPEINYGFGFSLYIRNFDINAFFEGLARESFSISNTQTAPYINGHQVLKAYADDHWTPQNKNVYALYPRFSTERATEGYDNNSKPSTWFIRNGSFLRIKRVEIGYLLPVKAMDAAGLNKMRIYVSSRNLYHFSKFKLWDPEMGSNGLGYPLQRTFNIGMNIRF